MADQQHDTSIDLKPLAQEIEAAIEKHIGKYCGGERPAFALAFSWPPTYDVYSWVTNVRRSDGIKIFRATADEMEAG